MKQLFIHITDLAAMAEVTPDTVRRHLYRGLITQDGEIQHGRFKQPIFLASRSKELVQAIQTAQEITASP